MTNALLTILCVLTAADLALGSAAKVLNYFWPKSKVTKEVNVIKSDVDEAEADVAKLAGKQSGRVRMTLLAVIALLAVVGCSMTLSCGALQHAGTTVEQDAIDCAKQNLGQTVTAVGLTVLADVAQIIQAGSSGWQAALDKLAAQYGSDAIQCAANDVLQALKHASGTNADAVARAQAYTAGHHFQ